MIDLPDIVGQDEAIGRLQGNLAAERMPHAFIFAGPAGVGRRTTAMALAKMLLCYDPQTDPSAGRLACGKCDACTMFDADTHPDFHLIYKELARFHDDPAVRGRVMQSLGIPVIRQFLLAPVGRVSTCGRGKVFVVLEAELLNASAQNALLKTLEEPPSGVTIILICRQPEQLLPTTRSRCSLIRFGPLPEKFVTGKLIEEGLDEREAAFWSAFTGGAIGRALQLAGAGLYPVKRDLIDRLANLGRGGDAQLGEHLAKTTDDLANEAVKQAKKDDGAELSKNLATRRATGAMLELIAGAYRDALFLATGTDRPMVNADQRPAVETLAERFEPVELAEMLEQLSRLEQLLWRNVSAKVIWDNVVITCASAAFLGV